MFYGWRIVWVVFLTHFISVGLVFYSYGVFFKALAADFGGSRLGVATGLVVMNVAVSAISPYLGRRVDRGSIRLIMCSGAVLMALGFLIASEISALWQLYLVMGSLLAAGTAMLGAISGSTLVANWFSQRRGMALGVSGMGISLSGLAMAPAATALVAAIGWRGTFVAYGVLALVTVLPAVWFVVVDRPEQMGLYPDGAGTAAGPSVSPRAAADGERPVAPATTATAAPVAWSTGAILLQRNFWVIGAFVALNFCGNSAVLTHIVPHATDIGFEPLKAAWVLSSMAGVGVLGKVLFGWIVDRIPKRLALWAASGLQAVGVTLILLVRDYEALLLAGAIFGLGMGGMMPLWGALIGAGFGRSAFGRVMGLMAPFMLPVQILGIPYAGWVFDRYGRYDVAFVTFLAAYALAMAGLLLLRLPPVEPGAVASAGEDRQR